MQLQSFFSDGGPWRGPAKTADRVESPPVGAADFNLILHFNHYENIRINARFVNHELRVEHGENRVWKAIKNDGAGGEEAAVERGELANCKNLLHPRRPRRSSRNKETTKQLETHDVFGQLGRFPRCSFTRATRCCRFN